MYYKIYHYKNSWWYTEYLKTDFPPKSFEEKETDIFWNENIIWLSISEVSSKDLFIDLCSSDPHLFTYFEEIQGLVEDWSLNWVKNLIWTRNLLLNENLKLKERLNNCERSIIDQVNTINSLDKRCKDLIEQLDFYKK